MTAAKKDEKNSSEARIAYGNATKALKEKHAEEFAGLLDEAYAALGLVSPRVKREARQEAERAAREAAAARREERRLAKIERLQQELDALNFEVAVEGLVTADQVEA